MYPIMFGINKNTVSWWIRGFKEDDLWLCTISEFRSLGEEEDDEEPFSVVREGELDIWYEIMSKKNIGLIYVCMLLLA